MISATPYYLLDRHRLSRVEQFLHPKLQQIVERWWPGKPAVAVAATASLDNDNIADETVRHIYRCDDGCLVFFGSDEQWAAVAGEWLGCQIDQPTTLTMELERQFRSEIANTICPDFSSRGDGENADTPVLLASLQRPGAGGIMLSVAIGRITCEALISAAAFPLIFQQDNNRHTATLVAAADALATSTVILEARLPSVKVPLMTIAELRSGDFIDLQHDLSGEVVLVGRDAEVSVRAELGRRGACKAAIITSRDEE